MTIKVGNPSFVDKHEPWMNETAHALFAEGKSITGVCVALGISRETYYRWRDDSSHPFSEVAKLGEMLSQAYLEERGLDGTFGGIDKFAGSTWQFIMKNRFRDHYSDQQKPQDSSAVEMLLNMLADKKK